MNDIKGFVGLLSETAKKRSEKADENRRNGIPDPLNDLVDVTIKGILDDEIKRKLKKRKRNDN